MAAAVRPGAVDRAVAFPFVKLDGSNYNVWSARAQQSLIASGLWLVVSRGVAPAGAAVAAEDDEDEEDDEAGDEPRPLERTEENLLLDDKAKAAIGACTGDDYIQLWRDSESSKQLWEALRAQHVATTRARQLLLRRQFNTVRMERSESLHKYAGRVRLLKSQLVEAGSAVSEDEMVQNFLAGLPSKFETMCQILTASPLALDLDSVLTALLPQEQHGAAAADADGAAAFSVAGGGLHGHRGGHRGGGYQGRQGQGQPVGPCWQCGRHGHRKANCPQLKQKQQGRPRGSVRFSDGPGPGSSGGPPRFGQAHMATLAKHQHCSGEFVLDSGCTVHMCRDLSMFVDGTFDSMLDQEDATLRLADGSALQASGKGSVGIHTKVDGQYVAWLLPDVLYVPELSTSLLSVSQLAQSADTQLKYTTDGVELVVGGEVLAQAWMDQGLPVFSGLQFSTSYDNVRLLELPVRKVAAVAAMATTTSVLRTPVVPVDSIGPPVVTAAMAKAELWHRRMGHLGYDNLSKVQGMVSGMDTSTDAIGAAKLSGICEPCIGAKHPRSPRPASSTRTTACSELVHMDVCGPIQEVSHGGHRYIATFLDDYSNLSVVKLLKYKSDVSDTLVSVLEMLANQSGRPVKAVRSDRGREYLNARVDTWLEARGIVHQKSSPYTPKQNGKAERLNRTLLERVRAMLLDSGLSMKFWGEAALTANYIRNRSPSANLDVTPYQAFYGAVPDVSMMRVFGCTAFTRVPEQLRRKLDSQSEKGLFVGYESDCKSYRVWVDGRIVLSCDVKFDEHNMSRSAAHAIPAELLEPVKLFVPAAVDDDAANNAVGMGQAPAAAGEADLPELVADSGSDSDDDGGNNDGGGGGDSSGSSSDDDGGGGGGGSDAAAGGGPPGDQQPGGRRSGRTNLGSKPKEFWKVNPTANAVSAGSPVVSDDEPLTYKEAMSRHDAEKWKQACDEEMQSLLENGTYVLQRLPAGAKALKCKWVFKRKRDATGKVQRHKSRLVAKGCQQVPGVDFNEVYAPVSKHATLRVLLAFAAENQWEVDHIDVKTAFLNGELEEELYMVQPPGYETGGPDVVCKLQKALYGLRQAPRAWYNKLKSVLLEIGFVCTEADPGLWVCKGAGGAVVYLLTYVDDLALTGPNGELKDAVKAQLLSRFAARDLGPVSLFLGMEVERVLDRGALRLTQHKYVRELLEKYGMETAKSVRTPLAAGARLCREGDGEGDELDANVPYCELVGALLYLAVCTRPDISFAVGALARFMSAPRKQHWVAAKRVLRYLKGTPNFGLCFWPRGSRLDGMVDADFAGDLSSRKSTSGYVFTLNGGAVSWSSKLQPVVAVSTTEAEYIAAAAAVKEALWLQKLVQGGFGVKVQPLLIECDSQGALSVMQHVVASQRSKHIDVQFHFVRDRVAAGDVAFRYIASASNIADCLTKAVPADWHEACTNGMGVYGSIVLPN